MDPRPAIARVLKSSSRVLVVCHLGPDGDCLGSALALGAAVRALEKPVVVASAAGVPAALAFLPGAEKVITCMSASDPVDVAVTLECSTLERAGPLAAAVRRAGTIVAIDHHADHAPYAHLLDWDESAAAAGEQVADLIGHLGVTIDAAMATNLLTAVMTDTGVFRYANTTARTLRLAADLVERGGVIHEIVRAVYEEQPASTLRLTGQALAGVTLHLDGSVATTVITPEMRAACGAEPEATSGLASTLRTIAGVRLAMSFEQIDSRVRVSIRARDGVRADRVAGALGGGGHPAAAGADVDGPLAGVVQHALTAAARETAGLVHGEQASRRV